MHVTMFTKISILQVLGAIVLFPSMLYLHIWELALFITRDLGWSLFFAQIITLTLMGILYAKLFFGIGWLETFNVVRGTLFLQFFLSVLFIIVLLVIVGDKFYDNASTFKSFVLLLLAYNTIIHGIFFIGMLAYASVSTLIYGGDL